MGKVIYQKWVKRDDLRKNRDVMYLFGDNLTRKGYGGQAAEMRGEPNAIGVATKNTVGMFHDDFFHDDQFEIVKKIFDTDLAPAKRHLREGGILIVPMDGLGTGLSRLPETAPKCAEYLANQIAALETL